MATDTDDLDRRIAKVFRMVVDVSKERGWTAMPLVFATVADSLDPPLLPCPFCGDTPIIGNTVVCCKNGACAFHQTMSVQSWNRREVPHGQ